MRQVGGFRSLPRRKAEHVRVIDRQRVQHLAGMREFGVALAGEADDNIRADVRVRQRVGQAPRELRERFPRVAAVHQAQNLVVAALQGNMEKMADFPRRGHALNQSVRNGHRLDGRDANALNPLDIFQHRQHVHERVSAMRIRADIHAGQDDFLMSARRKFRRFPPNILEFPAAVAASGVWHDAI